jgi:hypothetical protein
MLLRVADLQQLLGSSFRSNNRVVKFPGSKAVPSGTKPRCP